ncbi:MAG: hypothetical protein AB7O26_20185 [Planctomycetaceae bacterium]
MTRDSRDLFEAFIGDGRPLIVFTALCLALAGGFALFQSATGHFLPHDIAFLAMAPEQLCGINECRIVHFMIHDRVSFGGALIAISVLYFWLSEFPLKEGKPWAWWTLVASGVVGFGSFLTYLGYGYLDTWHGAATIVLLPCFASGLVISRPPSASTRNEHATGIARLRPNREWPAHRATTFGRLSLLMAALGMIGAGLTIQTIGMTSVFVPTDLEFMGLSRAALDAINPRLIPLIAHDRAGFGGAVATAGLLTFASVWFGSPSRALWQSLVIGGLAGWSTAIFVHPAIGYTDAWHLAPAVGGAALFMLGVILTRTAMRNQTTRRTESA